MKNLRKFKTEEEFEKYARTEDSLVANGLYLIESGCKVKYYDQDEPFYIEAIENLSFNLFSCFYNGLSYSFDLKSWITIRNGVEGELTVPAGKKIYFKYVSSTNKTDKQFKIAGKYNVGGNLSSISEIGVNNLFLDETELISAENLIINSRMSLMNSFKGCINLISAPKIIYMTRDTTWADYLLDNTFEGCVNLTKCPAFWGYIDGARNTCLGCSNLSEIDIMSISDTFTSSVCFRNLLEGVSEIGLCTLNWNASTKVHNAVIANVPSGWDIRYYDSVNDKYYIKFTIDDTECIAEYGMTWGNWIKSEYNTIGLLDSDLSSIYTINKDLISANTVINATCNNKFKINHVYIEHIDGTLYTTCEWISNEFDNELSNGVAIINDSCEFVIAKEDVGNYQWSVPNGSVIPGILTTHNALTASTDYSGENNTRLMLEIDTAGAGYQCSNYVFPNGKTGYLGAAGEWTLVFTYRDNIEDALKFIGGNRLTNTDGHMGYWTSTQYQSSSNGNNAWTMEIYSSVNTSLGLWDGYGKNSGHPVRAFAKLQKSELQTEE